MAPTIIQEQISAKAKELGISEEAFTCALNILSSNREMVNALDNQSQMDEYIYRAIIKNATDKRKKQAEMETESDNESLREKAENDLAMMSKEELVTDAYYRAVLPIITKIVISEPVLRLHADIAADVVIKLADFKRKHRVTSITEIIVTRCKQELEIFAAQNNIFQPELDV